MNIRVRLSSVLMIALVCVLILSVFQSQASAKNGVEGVPAANPSRCDSAEAQVAIAGGPGFVSIAGATFTPMHTDVELNADELLYNPGNIWTGVYSAPVLLPQGAIVNKLVVYYSDVTSIEDLTVYLYRIELTNGQRLTMANIASQFNWGYGARSDSSIDFNTVDNQSFAYYAKVFIPADTYGELALIGIRVDYTFPGYLPCVNN